MKVKKEIEFITFHDLTEEEKEFIARSWANPINARYNSNGRPTFEEEFKSVDEISKRPEPTFTNIKKDDKTNQSYFDTQYFRVAVIKGTHEIVGTCRFGKYYHAETADIWDFGFNVPLKYWFNGYGAEMVKKIVGIAKERGVKQIIGGADKENYGSYKAMVRNGFTYVGKDSDGDYKYVLYMSKPQLTEEEIEKRWEKHVQRTKKEFGIVLFEKLQNINQIVADYVKRIQAGEDETILSEECLNKINDVHPVEFR